MPCSRQRVLELSSHNRAGSHSGRSASTTEMQVHSSEGLLLRVTVGRQPSLAQLMPDAEKKIPCLLSRRAQRPTGNITVGANVGARLHPRPTVGFRARRRRAAPGIPRLSRAPDTQLCDTWEDCGRSLGGRGAVCHDQRVLPIDRTTIRATGRAVSSPSAAKLTGSLGEVLPCVVLPSERRPATSPCVRPNRSLNLAKCRERSSSRSLGVNATSMAPRPDRSRIAGARQW